MCPACITVVSSLQCKLLYNCADQKQDVRWVTGAVTRALRVVGAVGNFVRALFIQFIVSEGENTSLESAGERSCAGRPITDLGAWHRAVAGKHKRHGSFICVLLTSAPLLTSGKQLRSLYLFGLSSCLRSIKTSAFWKRRVLGYRMVIGEVDVQQHSRFDIKIRSWTIF